MTNLEKFEEKQTAMPDAELALLVEKEIQQLCKTRGRSIKMCVPPMISDTDMLLCEMLKRFKEAKGV